MADAGITTGAATPELFPTLLRSFSMLFVVLALLLLVLWLIRKYSGGKMGGKEGLIRVLASIPLASKERIALVEVLGERLLIGITSQQITFLSRIEGELPSDDGEISEGGGGVFKTFLRRGMKGADP